MVNPKPSVRNDTPALSDPPLPDGSESYRAKMRPVSSPLDRTHLSRELTTQTVCLKLGKLCIYSITAEEAPTVMAEIGRIREVEFRNAGGGTGQANDMDIFDWGAPPYHQLIVWDADTREIVAMCRYLNCRTVAQQPHLHLALATAQLFTFTSLFQRHYLPYTLEVGRLVVNHAAAQHSLGLVALWQGLGAIANSDYTIRYLLWKQTLFPTLSVSAKANLLLFLALYYPNDCQLVFPKDDLNVERSLLKFATLTFLGTDISDDLKLLKQFLKTTGFNATLLLNGYFHYSQSVKVLGTALNPHWGSVAETAMLFPIEAVRPALQKKYFNH